jgi:hypothetical protein
MALLLSRTRLIGDRYDGLGCAGAQNACVASGQFDNPVTSGGGERHYAEPSRNRSIGTSETSS